MRSIVERLKVQKKYPNMLNPLLFDGNHLHPKVRERILDIVKVFLEYLRVDIRVLDIRLVGSNASYNYNEYSDLDIHIVTRLSEISDPETIARLYFDAAKKNFKDSYDITIKGINLELYIEDVNTSAVSNGVYSVQEDSWIKYPDLVEDPTEDILQRAEALEEYILYRLKVATTIEEVQEIEDMIYLYRKDALSEEGEISPGNLVFKSLRNKGILKKIKDTLRKDLATDLSLESLSTLE